MVFCWCTSFGFLNSWEFYFDCDGMTLRTPTGSPCKCKIILREASLGQQSVHWAPQLWSALRNIFIYLRFWEHLLETGHFSWMATSSFLSGMVTPAWSDMQLLGGSTWPVQAQWLIGGTCLGISPFISNGNQSLRQKSNILYRVCQTTENMIGRLELVTFLTTSADGTTPIIALSIIASLLCCFWFARSAFSFDSASPPGFKD